MSTDQERMDKILPLIHKWIDDFHDDAPYMHGQASLLGAVILQAIPED